MECGYRKEKGGHFGPFVHMKKCCLRGKYLIVYGTHSYYVNPVNIENYCLSMKKNNACKAYLMDGVCKVHHCPYPHVKKTTLLHVWKTHVVRQGNRMYDVPLTKIRNADHPRLSNQICDVYAFCGDCFLSDCLHPHIETKHLHHCDSMPWEAKHCTFAFHTLTIPTSTAEIVDDESYVPFWERVYL